MKHNIAGKDISLFPVAKQYGATVSFFGTPDGSGVKSVVVWKDGNGKAEKVVICDGRDSNCPRRDALDRAYREVMNEKAAVVATMMSAFFNPACLWPDGFRELVSETLDTAA